MQIILFIIFGFVVGLIARALMPGKQSMGILMTTLLGMVGSFLGGSIASLIAGVHVFTVRPAGIIGSVIGALIVLFLYVGVGRHRHGAGTYRPSGAGRY